MPAMRSMCPVSGGMSDFLVLRGEKVVPETVVGAPVDHVTLPLPTHEPEPDALGDLNRRVVLHDPGLDRAETELGEPERQHAGGGAAGVAAAGLRLVAEHDPVGPGPEV